MTDTTLPAPPRPPRQSIRKARITTRSNFQRDIGVRLNGVERRDVEDTVHQRGLGKVPAGKTRDRSHNPLDHQGQGQQWSHFSATNWPPHVAAMRTTRVLQYPMAGTSPKYRWAMACAMKCRMPPSAPLIFIIAATVAVVGHFTQWFGFTRPAIEKVHTETNTRIDATNADVRRTRRVSRRPEQSAGLKR